MSLLHVVIIYLPVSVAKRDTTEGRAGSAAACHFLSLGYYNVYMDLLLEIFIIRAGGFCERVLSAIVVVVVMIPLLLEKII